MAGSAELIADYVQMGAQAVWVVDPKRRRAYAAERGELLTERRDDLTVAGTAIRIPVFGVFEDLDELEMVIE
jgi:limonene-1,2-epoxide hydrolase